MSHPPELPQPTKARQTPIAVVGLGCWYPGARNPLQLWENILSRRLEFRRVPDCRLPNDDYCDPNGEDIDKTYARRCAVLDGFEFDWAGRRIPKSMFESTDLVHWLALEVAEQALKDSGFTPDTLDRDATGVIVGNTLTGDITRSETMRLRWPFVQKTLRASCAAHGLDEAVVDKLAESMETVYKSAFAPPTPDSLAGGLANTIAGRVCNYFDLHGGGYVVDGACSSSLLAVCTAARALSTGEMNVAVAGGIDISIDPFELVGFSRAGALSRGEMNVYDRAAAGFIAGEGCGFVVLKRLDDARQSGDRVYAVLRGWGVSSDGKGGIMTPSSAGQAMAIRRAYRDAGYSPAELDFVEGHGTGTKVGDQIELKGVFEAQTNGRPAPSRRTGMTSLKSIIGHTKAAAGIGAFIKAVMAVNRRVLPATGSCTTPHPVFEDTVHSLYPLIHGRVANSSETLRAGVSAMGFGGINSHVTLESGDAPDDRIGSALDEGALLASQQTSELMMFTAGSFSELTSAVSGVAATADQLSDADIVDLSRELCEKADSSQPIRAVVLAKTAKQLTERLADLISIANANPPSEGEAISQSDSSVWVSNHCQRTRLGYLFPGQGSQQLQMARKLVARHAWAREIVALADSIQSEGGLPTLSDTVFADTQRVIDREDQKSLRKQLARTEVAQVAIVTASVIIARYLEQMGVEPAACGGHSLGELTALHQAGAFDLETLLRLVSLRGRAMASPVDEAGSMAALFCPREQAEALLAQASGYAVIANINGPSQVVVSGSQDAITRVMELATAQGVSNARLNVSNAFHSRYVEGAATILRDQANVPQRPERLSLPAFSCVSRGPIAADQDLRQYLSNQITSRVDFESMIQAMAPACDLLIEVGPGAVLSKLADACLQRSDLACLPTASSPDQDCDLNTVLAAAFTSGVNVRWDRLFERRFSRPFVPVEQRKFITNPCEKPLAEVGQSSMREQAHNETPRNGSTVPGAIERFFHDAGMTRASLETYLGRRGEFLSDVIAADVKSTFKAQGISFPCDADAEGSACESPLQNGHSGSNTEAPSGSKVETQSNDVPPTADPSVEPVTAAPVAQGSPDKIEQLIVDIIHERTGFPADSLTMDLRLLDDLNLDSIKAGDVIATAARRLGALGPIDPASLADATIGDVVSAVREAKGGDAVAEAPATVSPEPMPVAAPEMPAVAEAAAVSEEARVGGDDEIQTLIVDIIHERTGFPADSLTPDLRLLDDLNLDSIKAGDVIATAARRLGALGQIDAASLADATIADVVQAVREAKGGAAVATPSPTMPQPTAPPSSVSSAASPSRIAAAPPPPPSAAAVPASRSTAPELLVREPAATRMAPATTNEPEDWVRSFEIELAEHRPSAVQQDLQGRHYRLLHEPSEAAFVNLLGKHLRQRNAAVSLEQFDAVDGASGDAVVEGLPYYVVAVLPKKPGTGESRQRLERMIQRLRRAVASTNPASAKPLASGVAFVQFGDGRFGHDGMHDFESCTAAGFARALHLESPALEVRIVDVADKLNDILATDFITNELAAEDTFRDAAYDRMGRRYETRHRQLKSAQAGTAPIPLGAGDVVLVTGGGKGITAELAVALAEKTGARFALVGSSPHPDQTPDGAKSEVAATLKRLAGAAAGCEYFACDLAEENAVRSLIQQVDQRLGRVTAVVHGAGRNTPSMASGPSAEQVLSEVSPKVLGAMHLLDALADRELRCLVGLTSIIGVTGIPGNSWYAFSNETLDLLLRGYQAEHPRCLVRSVSYSAWSGVGMGAKGQVEANLRRMGVGLIPPEEGVAAFMQALEQKRDDPQVIVTGPLGAIDTWRPTGGDGDGLRYVGEVIEQTAGESLTTRVKLSLEDDPYLLDHIYEGTCLFPAVFGMEAMAQVASCVAPENASLVRMQNIALTRPIIVGEEGEVELEIRASVTAGGAKGETVVSVGIRTERTQHQFEHFAAEMVFGAPKAGALDPQRVGEPLDIDPERDLYTGILFQGPRFRRWRDTFRLVEGEMLFDLEHSAETVAGEAVFGEQTESGSLLTGDPFARDVLLQSVQAIIPKKTGLPLSIERIELYAGAGEAETGATRRQVTSTLHVIADEVGKEHVAEIVVRDQAGRVRERVVGYRVKVLAIKDEYPSAVQLADLQAFDQSRFAEQAGRLFSELGVESPAMAIHRRPELHTLGRDSRRPLELPLLEQTVEALQQKLGAIQLPPSIDWLPSGKPVVANQSELGVSLSHDDDYCLCVANRGAAGCDLAPVTPRSREQWVALVGLHNERVLDQLVAVGDSLDRAGTRVWAAVEAVQKSLDMAAPIPLRVEKTAGDAVALATDELDAGGVVVTGPLSLHRNPERVLAVVAGQTTAAAPAPMTTTGPPIVAAAPGANGHAPGEPSLRADVAAPGESRSIDNVSAAIKWDGPRDQAVFEHRFVVTFKECATRGKHVQHTQYLGWMGSMRENGLLYLVPDMVLKLSDGKSGMATNWTQVDVSGEAMMGDVLVARLWMESMTDSSVVLACDFAKVLPGNRLERLAYVQQATTWVRLDGRNDPITEPFPKFLHDAFKSMDARSDRAPKLPELPESLGRLKLELNKLHATPQQAPTLLWGEDFSTCLDDSNIVANIYYSRYFHWQWRTSDLFLYSRVPQLMTAEVDMGSVRELVPLNSRIDYVRDAFPFDRIRTEMSVTRSTESAATLAFTHYRVSDSGGKEKLSAGTQDVVWCRRTPNGNATPEPFPLAVREAFQAQTHAAPVVV